MKEIHLWNFIYTELKKNNIIILAAVVDHEKGSPGKQGFKMAVSSNGEIFGSIGGGVMEFNLLKKCRESFNNNFSLSEIETLHHKKIKTLKSSGLICSGSQTNFIFTLYGKDKHKIKRITELLKNNFTGKIIYSPAGISLKRTKKNLTQPVFKFINNQNWIYEQPTGMLNKIYIIGGGHVGLAVSKVLSILDFYVVVIDDRSGLYTFTENKYADKLIRGGYNTLGKLIEDNSYVVIVTTGFESDKEALIQIIKKNLKYIGLMGTKAKIKKIYTEVVKSGIKRELLNKIHAPVGINIGSNTPEEIAVSIAAELIKIKNQ